MRQLDFEEIVIARVVVVVIVVEDGRDKGRSRGYLYSQESGSTEIEDDIKLLRKVRFG